MQSWPTGFWPDGSVKWTAHAVGTEVMPAEEYLLEPGAPVDPARPLTVTEDRSTVTVDTGAIRCRIARRGSVLVCSSRPAPRGRPVWPSERLSLVHTGCRGPRDSDTGWGHAGVAQDASAITTLSVLRSAWEVRCVRVDPLPDLPDGLTESMRLRVGVAGDGFDDVGVHRERDASPLGDQSATPRVAGPVLPARWRVVLVGLHGTGERRPTPDRRGRRRRVPARFQSLTKSVNPALYDAISAFYRTSGIPILCNTSLNDKGEPIVNTAAQALNFCLRKGAEVAYVNGQRSEGSSAPTAQARGSPWMRASHT